MTYLTDREIHVIGIQRTGQHAITSWILGHFDKVCYKNSMSQLGMRNGHGVQPRQVLGMQHLYRGLQECVDEPRRCGVHVLEQC